MTSCPSFRWERGSTAGTVAMIAEDLVKGSLPTQGVLLSIGNVCPPPHPPRFGSALSSPSFDFTGHTHPLISPLRMGKHRSAKRGNPIQLASILFSMPNTSGTLLLMNDMACGPLVGLLLLVAESYAPASSVTRDRVYWFSHPLRQA